MPFAQVLSDNTLIVDTCLFSFPFTNFQNYYLLVVKRFSGQLYLSAAAELVVCFRVCVSVDVMGPIPDAGASHRAPPR